MSEDIELVVEQLQRAIEAKDTATVLRVVHNLPAGEMPHILSHLSADEQMVVFDLIPPSDATQLVLELPETQAVQILKELPRERAAAILDELPSDEQADLLGKMPPEQAQLLLSEMSPGESADAAKLLAFPEHSAGGLMITEYLAFREDYTVGETIEDLRRNSARYSEYDVQYFYTVGPKGELKGVLRARDLLLSDSAAQLGQLALRDPLCVHTHTPLDQLADLFNHYQFYGLPVVDDAGQLVGMVKRQDVEEALAARAGRSLLKWAGIFSGEELRSMPLMQRAKGRTIWLTLNLFLDILAAGVIPLFENAISSVLAIVFFLPIISDMGGNAGNQAIGVTLRELTARLISPRDVWRVVRSELLLGLINGLMVGIIIAVVAVVWKGNPYLGLLVGLVLTLNTLIAVAVGASLPLVMKRLGFDPALTSAPILTTITDLVGFLLLLGGTQLFLACLV